MKLKTILFMGICGALLGGAALSGCGTVTKSLEALWEADCNAKTRYQTPTDRPYITREVTIPGGAPGVMLAGELTMPNGPGPFPGAVLISGSELADRDSFILGHKPFLVLADYLTRRGYAVYRHDDRGYGKSTGDSYAALNADFSADAAAALKWLRVQKGVDVNRVGYIGHSAGGQKGQIASQIEKADFLISIASGVESLGAVLLRQSSDTTKATGASEEDLKTQDRYLRKMLGILRTSETLQEAKTRIAQYALKQGASKKATKLMVETYATPWLMSEFKRPDDMYAEVDSEIARFLKSYDQPVLALYGGKDLLVSSDFNAPRTGPLLRNAKSRVVVFPNMNHFMQTLPAEQNYTNAYSDILEMCDIDTTFDPKALNAIGEWLDEVNATETTQQAQGGK